MQISRSIDPQKRIVHTIVTGEITLNEIRADMMRLACNSSYTPDMPGLIDMRNATARLSADEILELSMVIKANPHVVRFTRRALLVNSDLMYGLYRMFESFTSDGSAVYRVFRDEQAARAWIEEAITDP